MTDTRPEAMTNLSLHTELRTVNAKIDGEYRRRIRTGPYAWRQRELRERRIDALKERHRALVAELERRKCPACKGTGTVTRHVPFSLREEPAECRKCGGSGLNQRRTEDG